MSIKNVLVTGQSIYLDRFQYLFGAMSQHFDNLEYLPTIDVLMSSSYPDRLVRKVRKTLYDTTHLEIFKLPDPLKTATSFRARSLLLEKQIRQCKAQPDLIFHIFCLSSPLWQTFDIPYVMFLDYTMALARRNWPIWAPFRTIKDYEDWLNCEQLTYQRSHHLFCVSHQIKASLIQDYGIPAEKVTVTGSSANFASVYEGEKKFGTKQLMFNSSDFHRKGGDIVLKAFRQVRTVIPEASLVIFGADIAINEAGVKVVGRINSRSEMQDFLLGTDIVLAPALCDPFPVFPMEAMNFGVPCIVSDRDGNPDIIDDGLDGYVLSEIDEKKLAEKIIYLLQSNSILESMSKNAKSKIKTKLNWNLIGQNISNCIHEIS
jgi:glycosyltransferase involved in cell wall biosynthesis